MRSFPIRFIRDHRGAVTIEHVLVLALVGSVLVAGLLQFRATLRDSLGNAQSQIAIARGEPPTYNRIEEAASTMPGRDANLRVDVEDRGNTPSD